MFSGAPDPLLPSHRWPCCFHLILRPFLPLADGSLTDLDVFGYVAASVVFASTHFWKTTTSVSVTAPVDHCPMY